jgi:ribosome-binding protein aMBF1 (putative translation factor)
VYTKQETKALLQLGATIRKKRVELSMSQAQLAFEVGTDGRHIRRIEKGEMLFS